MSADSYRICEDKYNNRYCEFKNESDESSCSHCSYCKFCKNCSQCVRCFECDEKCHECYNCKNCKGCVNCINLINKKNLKNKCICPKCINIHELKELECEGVARIYDIMPIFYITEPNIDNGYKCYTATKYECIKCHRLYKATHAYENQFNFVDYDNKECNGQQYILKYMNNVMGDG